MTTKVADAAGCDAEVLVLSEAEVEALLDASRVAAHESGERINAPLICAVIGRAAAVGSSGVEVLARLVEEAGSADN